MKKKNLFTVLAATIFMSFATITSFAATKITSAEITINGDFEEGTSDNDISVTKSSSKYEIQSAKVTNTPKDGWESGDKPKIKIILKSKKNYEWDVNSGSIDVEGMDGSVSNVSKSGKKLSFVFTAEEIGGDSYDGDLQVSNVGFTDGTVFWDGAEDAAKYEVKLYRGSKLLKTQTTSNDEYDFSNLFTQSGTYKAKVRGVKGSHKGQWVETEDYTVSSDDASEIREDYRSSNNNSSSSSESSDSDNSSNGKGPSVPSGDVADINNTTFGPTVGDDTNNAQTTSTVPENQWVQFNNIWYYYQPATNTFALNQFITGRDGKNYYVGADGAMLVNSFTPDFLHYCGADGALVF